MSARQVRKTAQALLKDPTVGLAQAIASLAISEGVSELQTEFNYVRAKLSGKMQPSGAPNIVVRANQWRPDQKLRSPQRDALVSLEVMAEFFNSNPEALEDQMEITVIAVAQVLDGLREYSEANGGTVLDVLDPMTADVGVIGGPITTDGFSLKCTVQERSTL